MNQHKQTPEYTTAYRVAVRMFESAFAACERVPEVDRQLLSQEISNRLTQMSHATNEPVKHCLTPMVHAANEPVIHTKTVQVVGVRDKVKELLAAGVAKLPARSRGSRRWRLVQPISPARPGQHLI